MKRFRPARPLLIAALLTLLTQAALAEGPVPGVPWTGAVGVRRTVAEMMDAQRATGAATMPRIVEREKKVPDRRGLPQAPGAPEVAQWPPAGDGAGLTGGPADAITSGPLTPDISWTAATLNGVHPTFSFPADAMGAAGPTQYVTFVNGRIVSFDKATGIPDGALNVDPDVFFAPLTATSTSDPRIRYDRLSGRWFLVIINTSTPNSVLLAVSDAASNGVLTPSSGFSLYAFPIHSLPPAISSTCFADYPTLGIDANALYIGAIVFCGEPPAFSSCDGFVVRKSSVLGPGPLVVTALRGLVPAGGQDGPFVPQGVDNYDPAATEGYFIGVSNTLFGRLVLRRVANPGGTPSVSPNIGLTVPSTGFPLTVPHLGNLNGATGNLNAQDDRLFAAHLRNGRLWTAHNIAVNNVGTTAGTRTRNGARWYELEGIASPGVPSLVQSGTVFTATPDNTTDQPHFFFPTVGVSGQGHALMAMSTAGTTSRIDAIATGRLAGDPPGTMNPPAPFTASAFAYNPPGDPGVSQFGRRWGDYSYTVVDPIDDMTMWTIQMFCDATNSYGCRVIRMRAPLPAAPASAGDVPSGHASTLTTVVGTSTAGSGFYDPGPDLPGGVPGFSHVGAIVTADGVTGTPPTVNGVAWIDPTHVQLDLNTVNATPSLPGEFYTVTIVNPDGQAASGAVLVVGPPVGVGSPAAAGFSMGVVRPNPAAGEAGVDFSVGRGARVRITVLDLAGREIAVLTDGVRSPGGHRVSWSGRAAGGRAPSGMYFMRYESEGITLLRRFVLLK
jgi:hypothetical protein